MKFLMGVVLLLGLMVASGFESEPGIMVVRLRKAVVSSSNAKVLWEVGVSNSTPATIRPSHFSLASAIRAAKFVDESGNLWRVVRPKEIIDPPEPAVDFRVAIPGNTSVIIQLQTEGLENRGSGANQRPPRLEFEVKREVEVMDESIKRSTSWNCAGTGSVTIEWPK